LNASSGDPGATTTHFVAVDVETANADLASICQIGIVRFDLTGAIDEWQSLVNPEDFFDPLNVSIHGITEVNVRNAPRLPDLCDYLRQALAGKVVVCHTPFDRAAFRQAFSKYSLPEIECRWLDTARVARRTWPEVTRSGYGLEPLAERLGIQFAHHVAKEDARVAGQILLAAMAQSDRTLDEWLVRAYRPIEQAAPIAQQGDPDGPLFGEVVVFTGALSMLRREAAAMAGAVGCTVAENVTKETTILVVGDQDVRRLAGHDKSSKHRKAEQLIAKGQSIRIVRETDFTTLVAAV
jgi:DNA polymerase-3 subunit epsilon